MITYKKLTKKHLHSMAVATWQVFLDGKLVGQIIEHNDGKHMSSDTAPTVYQYFPKGHGLMHGSLEGEKFTNLKDCKQSLQN